MFLSKLLMTLSKFFLFTGKVGQQNAFPKKLTPEEEKAAFAALNCPETEREAEEKLISCNLRLVAHIAKKYNSKLADSDDLVSIGSIGLIKAVRTFDVEKKVNFSTYASRCITNEILMFFRAHKKEANEMSLDDPIGQDKEGNEITLLEILTDSGDSVENQVDIKLGFERLEKLIKTRLSPREAGLLSMRFGLFGHMPHTQKEVAKLLNISRSYVSRIETAALEKIRK